MATAGYITQTRELLAVPSIAKELETPDEPRIVRAMRPPADA
jgi:hypothetical protein